ncbi:hypothetical protein CRV01_00515 [Arcobacter sp. CECT 8983]|uniref:hypothetical protein n=1 Tax=Arcobacter sp. CECT 8983 TaxID=2044508 RepID=UPI00100BA23E|nr:hypothetical protein [Arcobacter sp. CECT 8983]RXJ91610.1 hypothetical protein CRV01_00515 [Arcobacter sp. CECT 8983]
MGALQKPVEEQIELAVNSNDFNILWELHKSPYMNVRRAVARNSHIDSKIADNLIADPVLNVSYMAKMSLKASTDREFKTTLTNCVTCQKSELVIDCLECEHKQSKMLNY